jgi:hypothetical protein
MASANTLHCPCFNLNVGKCMEIKKPAVVEFDYILWNSREFDSKTCCLGISSPAHTHSLTLSLTLAISCSLFRAIVRPLYSSSLSTHPHSTVHKSRPRNHNLFFIFLVSLQWHCPSRVVAVASTTLYSPC